jgi:tRNA (guanine10-N2)-methyltransferase
VVYDPFVGTGSILVSAGHFGAHCLGSDLDWKILHGKTKKGAISAVDNFVQYKIAKPELICSDMSVNMFRRNGKGFVDAILCDPPYGVRAGARKSGRAEGGKEVQTTVEYTSVQHTDDMRACANCESRVGNMLHCN